MKRLFFLLALFASFTCYSQTEDTLRYIKYPASQIQYGGIWAKTFLRLPDTCRMNAKPGAIGTNPLGTKLFLWNGSTWGEISGGGGGTTYSAGYGLGLSSTTFSVDTFSIASRAWRQKGIDSLAGVIDGQFVHLTGNETVAGVKTFSNDIQGASSAVIVGAVRTGNSFIAKAANNRSWLIVNTKKGNDTTQHYLRFQPSFQNANENWDTVRYAGVLNSGSFMGLGIQLSDAVGGDTLYSNTIANFKSNTRGVLFPQLTTTEVNNLTGRDGLFLYDRTISKYKYHNGSAWQTLSTGTPTLQQITDGESGASTTTGNITAGEIYSPYFEGDDFFVNDELGVFKNGTSLKISIKADNADGAKVIQLPNADGTFALSVNGQPPNAEGAITIPTGLLPSNNLSDVASAATSRTNLGATTAGSNFFTLTNPSAITFPRINADNTVDALSASAFRTAIGAGTGTGTVNSGAQYRLAYYATAGTTLSETSAITAARALISDANGVPTHSTVTSAELANLSGITGVTGAGSLLVLGTQPTFTTSARVPLIIGGTSTTSTLTLRTTTNTGATGADIIFQSGTNGGTELARMTNAGLVVIGSSSGTISGEYFAVRKDQNAATIASIGNLTNGTAARATLALVANGSTGLYASVLPSSYTTSGAMVASTAAITTDQSAGLGLATLTSAAPIKLFINSSEGYRLDVNKCWTNGAATGATTSVMDLQSTTKGFLPPRMTATQASAISSPAEGLMVYVTDTNGTFTAKGWWGYSGTAWERLNN